MQRARVSIPQLLMEGSEISSLHEENDGEDGDEPTMGETCAESVIVISDGNDIAEVSDGGDEYDDDGQQEVPIEVVQDGGLMDRPCITCQQPMFIQCCGQDAITCCSCGLRSRAADSPNIAYQMYAAAGKTNVVQFSKCIWCDLCEKVECSIS